MAMAPTILILACTIAVQLTTVTDQLPDPDLAPLIDTIMLRHAQPAVRAGYVRQWLLSCWLWPEWVGRTSSPA